MKRHGRPKKRDIRRKLLLTLLHPLEAEYIRRKSFDGGLSAAKYIRSNAMPKNWRSELMNLRERQGDLPKRAGRPRFNADLS